MRDDDLVIARQIGERLRCDLHIGLLGLRGHRLAAAQKRVAAKCDDDAHLTPPHRGDKNRLDCVHPVFRLIEDDTRGGFKHLVAHLHALDPEFLERLLAHLRLAVVEGGQAMQEFGIGIAGFRHHLRGDAVG